MTPNLVTFHTVQDFLLLFIVAVDAFIAEPKLRSSCTIKNLHIFDHAMLISRQSGEGSADDLRELDGIKEQHLQVMRRNRPLPRRIVRSVCAEVRH